MDTWLCDSGLQNGEDGRKSRPGPEGRDALARQGHSLIEAMVPSS